MVKGTQKQMVVIRTSDSRYYEQAYLVLRDGHAPTGEAEATMMAEANRILDECMLMPQPHGKKGRFAWRTFWLGTLMGAAVCVAVVLIVLL